MKAALLVLLYAMPVLTFEIICIIFRGKLSLTLQRGFGLILFSLSVVIILVITGITPARGLQGEIDWNKINFVPFYNIAIMFKSGGLVFWRNVAGNIIIFLPIGFFTPLLWEKCTLPVTLAVGFVFSVVIEALQVFLLRSSDVDDVFLNVVGTLLGYLLFCVMEYFAPRLVQRVKSSKGGISKPAFRILLGLFSVFIVGCFL